MRPGATAPLSMPRLAALAAGLLAAACSVQTEELTTSSIECTTNDDGSTTCSEKEDRPEGDDGQPPDGADLVCSGTGCVSHCDYGSDGFRCDITCENGLTCQSSCKDGACEISCDCPDGGGGGGGCEGDPTDDCCQRYPDDPACNPPCPDGSTDRECYCQDNADDPDCAPPPCPDGSTDLECYCSQRPEDPACTAECSDGSSDWDCYCKQHPEDPHCAA